MQGIGIFNWFGYPIDMPERAAMIKETGFGSTMLWWGDEFAAHDGRKETHPDIFRQAGLAIEAVHLPFRGINNVWLDNQDGAEMQRYLADCIRTCGECELPAAVLHVSNGSNSPVFNELGLGRFRELVELAARYNVTVALENLQRLDYLDYLFAGIKADNLAFCYDSGHDLVFAEQPYLMLDQYGHRLKVVHLHDNYGTMDQHRVPGEGKVDWPLVRAKLHKYHAGSCMLECQATRKEIKRLTAREYLQKAYDAARELLL